MFVHKFCYLLKIVFVFVVVVFLTDDLYSIVPVVPFFVVRIILRWGQHVFILVDRSCLFIRLIVVCVRSEASIVRIVQVDVRVWNVDVFTLVGWDVSVIKKNVSFV